MHNQDGVTFQEFKQKAEELEEKYINEFTQTSEKERIIEMQKDYWDIVETQSSEKFAKLHEDSYFIKNELDNKIFKVEYAADLPTNKFGSGFPTPEQNEEFGTHPWNFLNLNNGKDSLLAF